MKIDKSKIKFQTYSFSYGTTSFRVSELKYKIEIQLIRLKELRDIFPQKKWKDLQEIYFEILVEENLAKATSNNKAKDARQKTSSLVDLGLVDEERNLTEIGEKLYSINRDKKFKFDNIFFLRDDAYIYFEQLLKVKFDKKKRYYNEFDITPFLALIYLILELGTISIKSFKYAFPLCQNFNDVEELKEFLKQNSNFDIYLYLQNKISSKSNYQDALKYFLENEKNLDTFQTILMDRKSKKSTNIYLALYQELRYFKPTREKFNKLKEIVNEFGSSKLKPEFRKRLELNNFDKFKELDFNYKDEDIFYFIHTSKWKVNLEDYYDLNRRFLELSEIIIFDNDIYLDELTKLYFEDRFDYRNFDFVFDKKILFEKVKKRYKIKDKDLRKEIIKIKRNQKISHFNSLIDKYFTNEQLKILFENIKNRKDKTVISYTNWDCDIPTIFEYLVGIVFYKLIGSINLDFLNLSLNANLLPIRFASGNQADIIYELTDEDIIIEVTLTTNENQRRMELEPVIRHLGKYKLNKKNAFAIFIAPYLDPNVLVAFRAYKDLNFYDVKDSSIYVKGLDILTLSIDDLICLIDKNLDFNEFIKIKDSLLNEKEIDGVKWYKNSVEKVFKCN